MKLLEHAEPLKLTQRHSIPSVKHHRVWIPAGKDGKTFSFPNAPASMACRQAVGHNVLPKH